MASKEIKIQDELAKLSPVTGKERDSRTEYAYGRKYTKPGSIVWIKQIGSIIYAQTNTRLIRWSLLDQDWQSRVNPDRIR